MAVAVNGLFLHRSTSSRFWSTLSRRLGGTWQSALS
jgi:hypothetical protein